MDWIKRMQTALEFIEENILDDIDSMIVADKIDTTQFHFQRMFHAVTGVTFGEYVRRRRLTLAAQEIMSSGATILEIALKYHYESHAAFTKAFTKLHNITPVNAREAGVKIQAYPPIAFQMSITGDKKMEYKIKDLRQMKFAGRIIRTTSLNEENLESIPAFWKESIKNGFIGEAAGAADKIGQLNGALVGACTGYLEDEEHYEYMIGVECSLQDIPETFDVRTIPAGTYAVFNADGPAPDAIQSTWKRIFAEWFPATKYQHAQAPDFEAYPQGTMDRCDIYIPIVIEK
ncbi:MAG: AraC family transcriptional regulator [Spirochaetes bacterium]|nr:AraC family transcriptional regulator [Spirochaetota bacterium]